MASVWPAKNNYATGDVLTAANMNGVGDDLNDVYNFSGYAAGKNKIINGDFGIWQRGTSFSNPTSGDYTCDRWKIAYDGTGATRTISQQTFTAGTAPVAGYEGQYFLRFDVSAAGTGNTYNLLRQSIEDVRTFAGQTVTYSFWAKASSAISVTPRLSQQFGSSGSATVDTNNTALNITTSWVRYTSTFTVPSIAGKTIGTGSNLAFDVRLPSNTTFTFDIWGAQLEAGSTVSIFQTATGTIQGELAACQRYFQSLNGSLAISGATGIVMANYYRHQTQMRAAPTITVTTAPSYTNASALTNDENSVTGSRFYATLTSSAAGGGFATNFIYSASAEL